MLSSTAWCPKQKCNPENSSFVFIWKFFDVLQEIWDEFDLNTNTDEKKNTHRDLLSPSHWVGFDNEYRIEYKMRYVICLRCIFFLLHGWCNVHTLSGRSITIKLKNIARYRFDRWDFRNLKIVKMSLWRDIETKSATYTSATKCMLLNSNTHTHTITITLSQFNGWKRERFEI